METMRDIKRRRESIQSTGQITKAMKLVATAKLQKSREKTEKFKPYFNNMYHEVKAILQLDEGSNPFLTKKTTGKTAVLVITSDRGLAGGYNSNVVKLITDNGYKKDYIIFDTNSTDIFSIGKKGREQLTRKGYHIRMDYSGIVEPSFLEAAKIGERLLNGYVQGEYASIYLAYTVFRNTVSQIPTLLKLLPVDKEELESANNMEGGVLMNYEPGVDEILNMLVPKYLNSLIFGAMTEAYASENGARIQAMDAATNNAQDIIKDLELKYNRSRQSSITQELTEIVAGANAIS